MSPIGALGFRRPGKRCGRVEVVTIRVTVPRSTAGHRSLQKFGRGMQALIRLIPGLPGTEVEISFCRRGISA
jgi:hypothetical protein